MRTLWMALEVICAHIVVSSAPSRDAGNQKVLFLLNWAGLKAFVPQEGTALFAQGGFWDRLAALSNSGNTFFNYGFWKPLSFVRNVFPVDSILNLHTQNSELVTGDWLFPPQPKSRVWRKCRGEKGKPSKKEKFLWSLQSVHCHKHSWGENRVGG